MSTTALALDAPRCQMPVVLSLLASLPIVGFQVGTGGAATIDYLKSAGQQRICSRCLQSKPRSSGNIICFEPNGQFGLHPNGASTKCDRSRPVIGCFTPSNL